MGLVIVGQATQLLELLEIASKGWIQSGVNPSAVELLRSVRERIESGAISVVIDLLELTYRYALQSNAVDLAAPIHEVIYNGSVRGSLAYCVTLGENAAVGTQAIAALLQDLIPDPVILQAMLTNQPTTTSLVHTAQIQLGYLHRRTPALTRLGELLEQHRALLPIVRPQAFEEFLATLRRLVVLGKLLSD